MKTKDYYLLSETLHIALHIDYIKQDFNFEPSFAATDLNGSLLFISAHAGLLKYFKAHK